MCIDVNAILSDENIISAIEYLKTKKNVCGDDGVWLHDLDNYWNFNKAALRACIRNKEYIPQLVHEKVITMPNGKHRPICLFSSVDRMILRAVLQIIQIPIEKQFSGYSFAYQMGKGVEQAIRCSAEYIEKGYEYIVKIDIEDFFDNINHEILLNYLRIQIKDSILYELLEKYISCDIEKDCRLQKKTCGILQGSPISPLLSNLYLTELDKWMELQGYLFVRFADDINIYVSDLQKGYSILAEVENKMKEYHLEINREKSGIFSVYSKSYLGYKFEKIGSSVLVKRNRDRTKSVYSEWNKNAIEKIAHDYYIVNDGILTKKDFTLLFANEEKKQYIPLETTESINIYSNVEITPNFLESINQKDLNLNIFNRYGVYIGSFYAANQKNCMKCLIKQVEIYQNGKRIEYAKKIDIASLHNIRSNLRYYMKHYPSEILENGIKELSNGICMMKSANDIKDILLIEARCRQKYYECFNQMIFNEEFHINGRNRRPPKDELNAMISFGNVYLYQKIAQMIRKTSMDIRISFVHSAMKRYENLNLDIADIFKPLIVDRVICTLINKKMIVKNKHFQREEQGGVFLNQIGKQIMLQELECKLKKIITIKDISYTYERLIYREIKKIENSLLTGDTYKAFKHQI